MRALVSTLLASVCVLGVAVGARGSESGSQCPMLLKRVSLTGSIKTLACYRMRTDGYAKFTRDHRWLIYQPRGFEYRTSVVRIARTDGSADREVVRFTDGQITAFSVSPDDRTLAFTSTPFPDRSGIYGTWIVDLDGTKLRKISSETVVSAYGDSLGWSPDSKRIVFTRASSEPWSLITVQIADGATKELGPGFRPRWSPNGKWIAFERDGEIRIVSSSGGASHRLVRGSDGSWSPDSRSIAFFPRPDDPTVWIVGIGGGKGRAIGRRASGWFDREPERDEPVWSPHAKRIAYTASDSFRRRAVILVASVGTYSRPRPIARHPSYRLIKALSWTRDGRSIYYLIDTAD